MHKFRCNFSDIVINTVLSSYIRIAVRQRRNPRESADLTSIHELLNEIDQNIHPGLLECKFYVLT